MSNNTVPTPIVDRNGKQTTVHKKVDSGVTNTRATKLGAPTAAQGQSVGSSSNEYLDAVEDIVENYINDGVLKPTRTMNGDRRYTTGEILIGRDSEGSRVFVKMELEHIEKPGLSTNLEETAERWDISFSGSANAKHSSHAFTGGQIVDMLSGVQSGIGNESATELAELWEKNHLNSLNAGTEKQTALVESILAISGEKYDYGKLAPQIPDDNGYKYGSKWLYRAVPAEDIEKSLMLMHQAQMHGAGN